MKIINMTPHDVNIFIAGQKAIVYPSQGTIRLEEKVKRIGSINTIPLYTVEYEAPDLPEEQQDVFYIVSSMVKASCPNRNDLLVPFDFIRAENGNIIGCKAFRR